MSQLTLSKQAPRALVYAALAASMACAPIAARAASATANSTVTILAPVTITKTADLVFGTVAPAATAGTVTMSPADARSATGAVDLSQTVAGNAAKFNMTGNANSTFSITLPSSTSLTGPGAAMTLNAFTSTPSATGTFNSSGSATLAVGGTLAIGANQVAGSYTGSFSVTVDYN